MSAFLNNGVKQLLHVYRFRFHVFYSKAAVAATSDTNFLVETLVNSLGFSPQEALSTSAKYVQVQKGIRTGKLITSVIEKIGLFFHNNLLVDIVANSLGFSTEKVISTSAKVTFLKPENNKPLLVINFFQQIGLDISHIKTLVCTNPSLLFSDVEKILEPKTKLLQELGLSGSDIAKVISKSVCFLHSSLDYSVRLDLDYFRKLLGIVDSVAKAIKRSPRILWCNAPKKLPLCLTLSGARLGKGLNFFMKDLRYGAGYLASYLKLLAHSLEKRVMPRYEILKLLGKKKLSRGSLICVIAYCLIHDSKFLKSYVLPYMDERPEL
ncbi:uncharacterized protein LOC142181665 [Nicotiana tabacum]|uniref:Uncharacterized protein LOC142181665 n=1 Tax=Nicotiana tabacum TaxID=4097 RepID=A0AC58UNW1_TOBAC